jgi:glycosyltransferase involved in cell wall biosynthesis
MTRLGLLARRYCAARNLRFTTTYDTLIPEYLEVRHGVPSWLGYVYVRWFHKKATRVIAPTPSMVARLQERGLTNAVACPHGVDTEMFKPGDKTFLDLPRPIWLYVGRITPEKKPEDFLSLQLPGSKLLVGGASGGLSQAELLARYPDAHFVGVKTGAELARYYAAADVFIFPSTTDTFGLVMLEAMASGLPVAAYPVTGPLDVVTDERVGCLHEDLQVAALEALKLSGKDCREFAEKQTWANSIGKFASHLTLCRPVNAVNDSFALLRLFLDRTLFSLPNIALERLVAKTASVLFAAEPAGPYSQQKSS